ncbi:phosphohistidine phosphatase [Aliiroseovarius crassostreae]|uniref:Phosphoglycerate mutase n=1 Tax=Aliiroseovarius crassostreae TaxID=154981 RepID=A0A0N8IBU5_9RHOB|nr:histidine phosphatase family protein [Aliiroseovarius crassostreae]KPN64083.1 phosphoglycerate mutase [Aliiroseovarius crassostreae]SFU28006.1 phosphohistidine phosphatase [Aliiroseovarius crassostreae]
MSLTLILTRHAKSSWSDPSLDDHERPLNKRGEASAKAIGRWLAERGHIPDQVLSSNAKRTRETWAYIADKLVGGPEAEYRESLYLADPDQMLEELKGASGRTVMMIAHNPGTAYLARRLVATPPAHERFHHYPTTATAVIRFDVDSWSDVTWHSGTVDGFVVPRDLI